MTDPLRPRTAVSKPCVLFVVNDFGFFLSHRRAVAEEAVRQGYDVHVAAGGSADQAELPNITLHPLALDRQSRDPVSNARLFFRLKRLYGQVQPDLVHLVTVKPVILGGVAARLCGIKAIVAAVSGLGFLFVNSGVRARFLRMLVAAPYRCALGAENTVAIFQNPSDRELIQRFAKLPDQKTALIRGSGIDLVEFVETPVPKGAPVVLMAARLLKDKGVTEFAEAASELKSRWPEVRFVLAGEPDPGNPATVSEADLKIWTQSGTLELPGHLSDMPQVLAQSSIVVLPSYREGLPRVLIEAAASGRPVVTTDVPGCRDAIIPGETGLLVPARDSRALAEGIEALLCDRDLQSRMGRAGRRLATNAFDIRDVCARHMEIYDRLLNDRS